MKERTSERFASGCYGKQGFASATLAQRVAKRARQNRDAKLQVYRCKFCHQWHIGRAPGKF